MQTWIACIMNPEYSNGGYVPVDDPGHHAERVLVIEDGRGGRVRLENEEIGVLIRMLAAPR